ncbi:YheC/YheD family protein [Paenibacillus monticola]|uniref:YheC/YheD family protein n=1 Tax=Paenibacillus monticola TaxID=2666075 RepID=A0A7X2L254_9BACL|nr:YheC/YheD family protein [Paenibacillus monticola]MRN53843.1 YheC/YheD family protein [Paenibacillus monticola]
MRIQRVSSKWAKTKVILQNQSLSAYVPDTRPYNLAFLKELLGLYTTVYIKPDRGTYGIGVMRAEQRTVALKPINQQEIINTDPIQVIEEQVMYILRYGKATEVFTSLEEMHTVLLNRFQGRSYLIQKGIDLLHYRNRPFDLRVLTQMSPTGAWETTGMLGRVAAPQKIVTNYHNGGTILSVNKLFKDHMNSLETSTMINQLKILGVQIAGQLQMVYPRIREIGLDVAIDQHHDMWILEVNTLPAIFVFKRFPNKSIYRKIYRYALAYGRLKGIKATYSSHRRKTTRMCK